MLLWPVLPVLSEMTTFNHYPTLLCETTTGCMRECQAVPLEPPPTGPAPLGTL